MNLGVVIFSLYIFAHVFSTKVDLRSRKNHLIDEEHLETPDRSSDKKLILGETSSANKAFQSDSSLSKFQENAPQVLLRADYAVGKSGILLSNRGTATQGTLSSIYSVNNIQTDNIVKDGVAKYTTIEVPPYAVTELQGVKDAKVLEPFTASQNQKMEERLFPEISYKDKSEISVDLAQMRNKANKPLHNFPLSEAKYLQPRQASSQSYRNGPHVIETKIVAEKDAFLSEDSAIEGSSLPLYTYYPQSSYQMNGRYTNADVKNFFISVGGAFKVSM